MSLSFRRIVSGIVIVPRLHRTQTREIQMAAAWNSVSKRLIYAAALLALFGFSPVQAQDDHHPQRGFSPGNSYALSDIETISMSSGNLSLNVPLGSLPAGRGGSQGFRLSLTYNSKLYDSHIEEITNEEGDKENQTYLNRSQDGGWRYTMPAGYVPRLIKRGNEEPLPGCTYATGPYYYQKNAYIYKMQVIYPDGSAHEFRPTGYTDLFSDGYFNISANGWISTASLTIGQGNFPVCTYAESQATTGPMVYYSTDGSYTRLVVDHSESGPHSGTSNGWTLFFPDGSRVSGSTETDPQRMYDRNNNYVDLLGITYNNHPAKKIVDQLGRYIIIETDQANNQDYIYMQGVGGVPLMSTVKWKTSYVRKEYVATVEGEHRPNAYNAPLHMVSRVVDQIILPTQAGGLNYTFGYNGNDQDLPTLSPGWGELKSVTLPSGAKATYAWALDGVSAAGGGNAIFPTWKNVQNNKPKLKQLIYREEYDLSSPVSNSPCDPQSEACTTEEWVYGLEGVLPIILTLDSWITKVKGPDGGVVEEYVGDDPNSPSFNRAVKTIRADGTMTDRTWAQNRSSGMTGQVVNPYLKTEFTSIKDAAGNYVKTAIKDYGYDKNGNVTTVKEYDWVSFGSVSRDVTGQPTGIPSGAPLKRVTSNGYFNPTPDASDAATTSPNAYHQASAKQLLNAIEASEVSDGSQVLSRVEFSYDDYNTTGNQVERRNWDSTKGGITRPLVVANSIAVTTQYDTAVLGKVTQTTDALGTRTEYIYGSINGFADLYPTETRVAVGTALQRTAQQEYDFWTGLVKRATDVDNNVSTLTSYDDLGRPTLVRAAENKPVETRTRTEYNDTLRRVVVRSDLNAVGDEKLVAIQHYDQLSRIRLTRKLEDAATQSVDDEAQGIKVQMRYKYSGVNSYSVSSQPYREASSAQALAAAMGWSRAKADNSGRLMETQQFGGNSLPAPWSNNTTGIGQVVSTYDANTTTVMDQAGKVRRSVTDGLGRLIRVDEPDQYNNLDDASGAPFQPTSYTYDALDNLTTVTQGSQTRTFVYDSLKRLISATNPESGTINYQYDANGNLTQKTDARGVVTTYAYDVLNRNTSVTYSSDPAATPTVTHTYDGATNGVGRLWKTETSGASGSRTTINSYDALGRPKSQSQQFKSGGVWSIPYTVSATYGISGQLLSLTYPSGHTTTYVYDNAGRTSSFAGNLGDATQHTYSSEMIYSAAGAMTKEKFGTSTAVYNKLFYNPDGQLAEIRESTSYTGPNDTTFDRGAIINFYSDTCWGMCWDATNGPHSMTDNNGNLRRQEVYYHRPDSNDFDYFAQSYDYDSLNRLKSVSEKLNGTGTDTFKQAYTLDRWGNRTIDQTNTTTNVPHPEYTVDTANNRLVAPAGFTHEYDAAGNQTRDTYTTNSPTAGHRTYDAENRIIDAEKPVTGKVTKAYYTYNGDGQRVRRKIATFEIWQIYGFAGELLAEYPQNGPSLAIAQPQKEYGYRNGQLLVTAEPWINGAWNKPATQTDNLNGTNTAAKAVDGDVDGDLAEGHASATNSHANSWWQVDLQSVQTISSITVWGRTDCCPEMTSDFHVFVSDNPFTSTDLSATIAQSGVTDHPHTGFSGPSSTEGPTSIDVNRTGRYVRVQLNGTGSLVIGEVQVWSEAAKLEWMVTDQLGTPRMIIDKTGSLAGVSRHDYLPFGEELFAGTGGRTTTMGYGAADGVRQKFTQKERDNETGLDYFGARYYASTQGRFTGADDFWKDSHVSTPQSWNKYAYARNNPLKYFDPTGEKATVSIQTDEEHKRGKITVKASIALWTKEGSKLSKEDLQKAAAAYKDQIEKGWSGQYEQDGITYTVETTVDVQVYDSKSDAKGSGSQNILEVTNGPLGNGHDSEVDRGILGGPDTGRWNNGTLSAAHEFGHLLGVTDRTSGPELMNQNNWDPVQKANANDYGWTFGGAINEHRTGGRQYNLEGRQWETHNSNGGRWGPPISHTSTREFVGVSVWWSR